MDFYLSVLDPRFLLVLFRDCWTTLEKKPGIKTIAFSLRSPVSSRFKAKIEQRRLEKPGISVQYQPDQGKALAA